MSATGAVVEAAVRLWLGTPYRHQGRRRGVGCDCLGLVLGVWRDVYGSAPRAPADYAPDWAEAEPADLLLSAAREHCREKPVAKLAGGDLVLLRWKAGQPARHAGIATGDGSHFIHAYHGSAVVESALVPSWRRRIAGVFAFPDLS